MLVFGLWVRYNEDASLLLYSSYMFLDGSALTVVRAPRVPFDAVEVKTK